MSARATRGPRGRGGVRPPTSGRGRAGAAKGCRGPVLAVATGVVLLTAGIVSQQAGSGYRATAVLFALALLFVGGQYGHAIVAARLADPPTKPATHPWPQPVPDPYPSPRVTFDKGRNRRGDRWGPGGRYNPDGYGCGKKTAEFVAVAALALFAARKLFRT